MSGRRERDHGSSSYGADQLPSSRRHGGGGCNSGETRHATATGHGGRLQGRLAGRTQLRRDPTRTQVRGRRSFHRRGAAAAHRRPGVYGLRSEIERRHGDGARADRQEVGGRRWWTSAPASSYASEAGSQYRAWGAYSSDSAKTCCHQSAPQLLLRHRDLESHRRAPAIVAAAAIIRRGGGRRHRSAQRHRKRHRRYAARGGGLDHVGGGGMLRWGRGAPQAGRY